MDYPIPPSKMERSDLTKNARWLYDSLRRAGQTPTEAMRLLYGICREEEDRTDGRSDMQIPTLRSSRRRAASRIAKEMIARGKTDRTVRNATGISGRQIRRLKNELDDEVEAAPA